MPPFRGSDEQLDREIETLEGIVRTRVRRVARELKDLDRDLTELRRERARRRPTAEVHLSEATDAAAES